MSTFQTPKLGPSDLDILLLQSANCDHHLEPHSAVAWGLCGIMMDDMDGKKLEKEMDKNDA